MKGRIVEKGDEGKKARLVNRRGGDLEGPAKHKVCIKKVPSACCACGPMSALTLGPGPSVDGSDEMK